jgi:hypothetical protein
VVLNGKLITFFLLVVALFLPGVIFASSEFLNQTRESLQRVEEVLKEKWESELLPKDELSPMIVSELTPYSAESDPEFRARALATLDRSFRGITLRICQICLNSRVRSEPGLVDFSVGEPGIEELKKIDAETRGDAAAAKSFVSMRESSAGVSIVITSLVNGAVLVAEHFTPELERQSSTAKNFNKAQDLLRRIEGKNITHAFGDFGVLGYSSRTGFGAHVALDWMEQWGVQNQLLSGFSFSFVGPVLGVGPTFGMVLPGFLDATLGGKVHLSLVNGIISTLSRSNIELFDPTVTFNGYARIPFGRSNYGAFVFVTSSISFGVGVSTLNTSFLPVLP